MSKKKKKKKKKKMVATSTSTDFVDLRDQEKVQDVLVSSILNLWETVNNLTRLRPSQRERYRVTIFGSARVPPSHWVYKAVRDLAAELTRLNCDIITGGGPGLMQAANEGAHQGGARKGKVGRRSLGIRVALPFEQEANAFVTEAYEHRTFFSRLHHFVLVSDAFVVVPGGIGTVLELMMIWQLLQVRKLDQTPLILVGKMYPGLVEWCRKSMVQSQFPLASAPDMDIPVCVEDGPSLLKVIHQHHAAWKRSHTKRR